MLGNKAHPGLADRYCHERGEVTNLMRYVSALDVTETGLSSGNEGFLSNPLVAYKGVTTRFYSVGINHVWRPRKAQSVALL